VKKKLKEKKDTEKTRKVERERIRIEKEKLMYE
jgi:hypothetical protein